MERERDLHHLALDMNFILVGNEHSRRPYKSTPRPVDLNKPMKGLLVTDASHPSYAARAFSRATLIRKAWKNKEQSQGSLGLSIYLLGDPGQAAQRDQPEISTVGVKGTQPPAMDRRSARLAHPGDLT